MLCSFAYPFCANNAGFRAPANVLLLRALQFSAFGPQVQHEYQGNRRQVHSFDQCSSTEDSIQLQQTNGVIADDVMSCTT